MKKQQTALVIFLLLTILVGLVLWLKFSNNDQSKEIKKDNPSELITKTTKKEEQNMHQTEYFWLEEGMRFSLVADIDILGESIHVLKQHHDAYLVEGTYGNKTPFYRLYRVDNEGVNIYFESQKGDTKYEVIERYIEEDNYEEIFSFSSNQEFFILKHPYVLNNNWNLGKISAVSEDVVTVTLENNSKYIFKKGIGLVEIHYYMPEEMASYFETSAYIAYRTSG